MRLYAVLFVLSVLVLSCKKEKTKQTATYDREAWLTYTADEIIVPQFQLFGESVNELAIAIDTFNLYPNSANLTDLKAALTQSRLAYQKVRSFGFGPAENNGLFTAIEIFPANTTLIESYISSGSYDLESAASIGTRGFPAIEYLLYHEVDSVVLFEFIYQPNRSTYLSDLKDNALAHITPVVNEWNSTYRNAFINAKGSDVGSSLSLLVNHFNMSLELAKNAKLAIPMGKRSLGTLFPEKVESPFEENSLAYLKAQTQGMYDLFNGVSVLTGNTGPSLSAYVSTLGANFGNTQTSSFINQYFQEVLTGISTIEPITLKQAVITQNADLENVYSDYQSLVIYTKTEMPSILGVSITYQDNDGD